MEPAPRSLRSLANGCQADRVWPEPAELLEMNFSNVSISGNRSVINGVVYNGSVSIINGQVFVDGKLQNGGGQSIKGDGQAAEESRNLSDHFTRVEASGINGLQIKCGSSEEKLQLQGESNILPLIETRVEDGTLHIGPKPGESFSTNQPIQVTLFMDNLDNLELSGSVDSQVSGLHSERLNLDLSGSSKVKLEGTARKLDLDLSGASSASAMGLMVDDVRADMSGASKAFVAPRNTLEVDGSGASSLAYQGNPKVSKDLSGAAQLHQL